MASKTRAQKPAVVLEDISDKMLLCRDLRHPWDFVSDYTVAKIKGSPRVILRHLRCPRCTTERLDTYSVPSFELIKSTTKYPKGYLLTGSGQHARVADVRREMFTRRVGRLPR